MRRVGIPSLAGLVPGRPKPPQKQGDLTPMLDGAPRYHWREIRSALADLFGRQQQAVPTTIPDPRLDQFLTRRRSEPPEPDQGT